MWVSRVHETTQWPTRRCPVHDVATGFILHRFMLIKTALKHQKRWSVQYFTLHSNGAKGGIVQYDLIAEQSMQHKSGPKDSHSLHRSCCVCSNLSTSRFTIAHKVDVGIGLCSTSLPTKSRVYPPLDNLTHRRGWNTSISAFQA